jgi:ABC-2 type transport system ATP-binding protein
MIPERIAVEVLGLKKYYKQVKAVDGVTFQVKKGEIFGMVGPNGSGKTTTIECIEGMRRQDEGQIRVLGLDPQIDFYELRERCGIQLQSANLPRRMRVGEALDLFASFYRQPRDWRSLLQGLQLADKERVYFSQLSGGQQQRLFVALALINNPEVVFLDELTTGLDPRARHQIWDLVREMREQGTTIFLTTHYMDEAERLCDRVAIIDQGQVIAMDSPSRLVGDLGMATRISFQVNNHLIPGKNGDQGDIPVVFDPRQVGVLDGVQKVEQDGDQVTVFGNGEQLLSRVITTLETSGVRFQNLRTAQANLEDVFLCLTGQKIAS